MKPSQFLIPMAVFGALVGLQPAHATPLPTSLDITNYSFEDPPLSEGPPYATSFPGWTVGGSSPAFIANPDSTSFPNAGDTGPTNGVPTGGDGKQSLGLYNISNVTSDALTLAASPYSIAKSSQYTLTVAVGNTLGNAQTPSLTEVGFLVGSGAGATYHTVVFDPNTFVPDGEFRDFSFSYTSNVSDVGQDLRVFLSEKTGYGANLVAMDNVRVAVLPAPEPSTWAMMGLGVGALLYMSRRRRRSEAMTAALAI